MQISTRPYVEKGSHNEHQALGYKHKDQYQ